MPGWQDEAMCRQEVATRSDDRERGVCRDRRGALSPEDQAEVRGWGGKWEAAFRNADWAGKSWSELEIQASHRKTDSNGNLLSWAWG